MARPISSPLALAPTWMTEPSPKSPASSLRPVYQPSGHWPFVISPMIFVAISMWRRSSASVGFQQVGSLNLSELRAFLTELDLTLTRLESSPARLWVERDADHLILGSTG